MKLTPAEQRAVAVLHRDAPRHPADLFRRDRVRFETLRRLTLATDARPALVRRLDLKPACWLKVPYTTFFVLTADGEAARAAVPA